MSAPFSARTAWSTDPVLELESVAASYYDDERMLYKAADQRRESDAF